MKKRILAATALLLFLGGCFLAWRHMGVQAVPGLTGKQRTLLRIWTVGSPGGGQAWLKQQLRAFEKANPGISTWVRTVATEDLGNPENVLPDVVLYMPGDLTDPDTLFLPLAGEVVTRDGLLREELLRCGRWQQAQYGLPLCWGGWVLAIDAALEPGAAFTPAPTTLLGRPAATHDAMTTQAPGYPYDAAAQADCSLQSPGGCALFTAGSLLETHPPLPEDFGTRPASEVYAAFRSRQCPTAMLTTGQATAFASLTSGGSGFPFRLMVPDEIITDQIWLASITADAPPAAAMLLSHLTAADAQKGLAAQELHTVRKDLTLYAAGAAAQMEQAGQRALAAINAYVPSTQVQQSAWQFFQGTMTLNEALLPLM